MFCKEVDSKVTKGIYRKTNLFLPSLSGHSHQQRLNMIGFLNKLGNQASYLYFPDALYRLALL